MDSKHTIAARLLFGLLSATIAATIVAGKVQGTSILVSTNSDGVTQLSVSKPTLTEEQVISYIMNPFSHPKRSIQYGTITPQSGRFINVVTDPLLLLAPIETEGVLEADPKAGNLGEDIEVYKGEDYYVAYILPNGLSSLPAKKKVELLSDEGDVKKVGVLLFPNDLDAIKAGERTTSSNLFPLECIRIKEIKVLDGEMKTVSVDSMADVFAYAGRYYGRFPWLVLRDVKEKVVQKREVAPDANSKEYGTVYLDKDGNVSLKSLVPNPVVPVPEIPPIPWFGPIPPFPYPFYPFVPPLPYWNPNFYWPIR